MLTLSSKFMAYGLSFLMGLEAAGLFIIFTSLIITGFTLLSLPFLYVSLVSLIVSLASHPSINLPTLLGKKTDGTFPFWSLVLFSPYLYLVRFVATLERLKRREAPYTEVHAGLYVGGWPFSPEKLPPGNPAVIDRTCEFPRVIDISENDYLCIPTWDTRPPDPTAIESAVQWACRKRANGAPVFIHCASGHGRSVAVMCALLVALWAVNDVENAANLIREKRPSIKMQSSFPHSLRRMVRQNRLPLILKPEPIHTVEVCFISWYSFFVFNDDI